MSGIAIAVTTVTMGGGGDAPASAVPLVLSPDLSANLVIRGGSPQDTAQHTLEFCPTWTEQCRVLKSVIGDNLSLPAVVQRMVGSEEACQRWPPAKR